VAKDDDTSRKDARRRFLAGMAPNQPLSMEDAQYTMAEDDGTLRPANPTEAKEIQEALKAGRQPFSHSP
jgi:hypothetical protein